MLIYFITTEYVIEFSFFRHYLFIIIAKYCIEFNELRDECPHTRDREKGGLYFNNVF